MTQKLPTIDSLNDTVARIRANPGRLEWQINMICNEMKDAARRGIRYVRLPPDEPFIAEIIAMFEKDQYTVKREYIRVKSINGGFDDRSYVGDEFVGYIITWLNNIATRCTVHENSTRNA